MEPSGKRTAPSTSTMLGALIQYSPLAIICTDIDGNVMIWNPAAERIFGWREEEVLDRKNPIVPDDKQEEYLRLRENVRKGEPYFSKELRRQRKDGAPIFLNASLAGLRDADGTVIALVAIFEDITERKLKDDAIRESEKRFRGAFENAAVGASMVDLKGRFLKVNRKLCEMTGYSEQDLLTRTFSDITHPDDVHIGLDYLKRQVAGELEFASFEKRYIRKDGSIVHFIISPAIIRDANGTPQYFVGLFQDITERKLADEMVGRLYRQNKLILNSAGEGIYGLDLNGNTTFVNPAAAKMIGWEAGELIGRQQHDILHHSRPDGTPYPKEECKIYAAFKEGKVHHVTDEVFWRKDGTSFPVEYVSTPIREGGAIVGAVVVFKDISDQVQITESLKVATARAKEEKAKTEAFIAAVGDAISIEDTDFRIIFQNQANIGMFGNHIGEQCYRAYHKRDSVCDDCHLAKVFADGQIHKAERSSVRENGLRYFEFTASPLKDASGAITGGIELIRDITERKRAEEELRRHREQLADLVQERTAELQMTNEQLLREIVERERVEEDLIRAQKLESLGILAGGIAHDFNNLLTTVFGNISMAILDLDQQLDAYQKLVTAEQAMRRAQDLTQQLLTFSKGGTPVKQTTSLGDLIREAAGFVLRGSRARCDIAVPADLWLADVDEGQISQVIHNLVINADQAMPEGGAIAVRCENATISGGGAPLVGPGKYVKITVRDTGVGILKEHMPKIFDPYFTTKQRGSGLGLATAYSIIRKHGGCISVESEPGGGAVFTILLPASAGSAAARTRQDRVLTRGSGKILIMDDEEDVRKTTGAALRRLGYTVDFAEEGARAVELYQEALRAGEPFHAVIMDLTIPGGMGGKEAVKRLLAIDPALKAIVSSGYSNDPIMADYRSHGFAGVVSKPYRLKELSETVHRVMTQSSAGRDAASEGREVQPRS